MASGMARRSGDDDDDDGTADARRLFRLDTPPLVKEYRARAERSGELSLAPLRLDGDDDGPFPAYEEPSPEGYRGAARKQRPAATRLVRPRAADAGKLAVLRGVVAAADGGSASDAGKSGAGEPPRIITESNGVRSVGAWAAKASPAPPRPPPPSRSRPAPVQVHVQTASSDKVESDGYASSPNSLTACSRSSTQFGKVNMLDMSALDLDEEPARVMFFGTGVRASELAESASHPPQFKEQYTVTGQVRKVKLKRKGPPLGKRVEVNGHQLALFKYKGKCYAIKNACCHQGGPLYQGDIEDIGATVYGPREGVVGPRANSPCIACPWHGWRFDLRTGKCLNKEDVRQDIFPCRVDHGEVKVGFEAFDASAFGGSEDF